MNIIKSRIFSHNAVMVFSLGLMFLLSSCVSKTPFLTSDVIPAARGYVEVNKDDNQNYIIQVELEYLAEASRLNPPKQTYVIWMESAGKTTKNIGQINSSSNSNKLRAKFETSSSFEPTRIFITAEDDGTVSYPGSQMVLTTGRVKG